MLDTKLTFWDQIRKGADKAVERTASLSRVMTNIGGPQPCVRHLLLPATESIVLYGVEVGANSVRYEKYRKRLSSRACWAKQAKKWRKEERRDRRCLKMAPTLK